MDGEKNTISPRATEDFRQFFPKHNDCKVYLGIAGFSFSSAVIDEARKYGVGIIKQVGDAVEIIGENLKVY